MNEHNHPPSSPREHITICVCTYKRPLLLKRLLLELGDQNTDGLFTYSVVVVDNDEAHSAQPVVSEFTESHLCPVSYYVEPRQNIALARNKAIEHAQGDYVAFIDDDECPTKYWLLTLYRACQEYQVDGALGPVKPQFDERTPDWVVKGNFYNRQSYPTGFVIDGKKGRTGNVLLRRQVFSGNEQPFRPEFLTGEDQDFFRRMIERKHVFIWCDEAMVYEVVPSNRWKRSFMLKRALLRGKSAVLHPTFGARDVAKSVIAVPVYTAALPLALILGHHRFMAVLIKLCDHVGKLLAVAGCNMFEHYVTE